VLMIVQNLPDIAAPLWEGILSRIACRQTGNLAVHKDGGRGQSRRAPQEHMKIMICFVVNPIDPRSHFQTAFSGATRGVVLAFFTNSFGNCCDILVSWGSG